MKRSLLFFFSLIASICYLTGQQDPDKHSAIIEKLSQRLHSVSDDSVRMQINDSISGFIDSYSLSDTVFTSRFDNARYIGQITSADSVLKIITWNMITEKGENSYFCYLIRKRAKNGSNIINRLTGKYLLDPPDPDTTYDQKNWYGALYYEARPVPDTSQNSWILLGIDYGNPEISRKIIDVVTFNNDGTPTFGDKIFHDGNRLRNRIVHEYANGAVMSLRFLNDTSIVFDHLVPMDPGLKDNRKYYAPDYSYDAYIYKNGIWHLSVNVDVRNKEKVKSTDTLAFPAQD